MPALLAGLETAAARLGTFLLQLLGFAAILVVGWIVARLVQSAVTGVLHRVKFDNLVERGGVRAALERTGYDASGILGRVAFWAVMLVALTYSLTAFGPNPLSAVLSQAIAYLPRVFAAGLIIVLGAALAVVVREAVDAAIGGTTYGKAIAGFSGGAVLYVAVFMALDELAIASAIVTGLFYASLAAIAGTVIVAAGGGGIPVMTQWWQRASNRVESEAPQIAMEAQGAQERIRDRAQERAQEIERMRHQQRQPVGAGGGAGRRR